LTTYIENQEYLHIQREFNGLSSTLWAQGEIQFIGQKKNRFFEFFDYADARFNESDIRSVINALGHEMKIAREFVFEAVRKEFFPSHPSRQRCLWVIDSENQDSLEYWKSELGTTDKLLRLKLTGKIHVAN